MVRQMVEEALNALRDAAADRFAAQVLRARPAVSPSAASIFI
jgi:hypothetical protein